MKSETRKNRKQKDPPIRTNRETRKKEIRAQNLLIIEALRALVDDGVNLVDPQGEPQLERGGFGWPQ